MQVATGGKVGIIEHPSEQKYQGLGPNGGNNHTHTFPLFLPHPSLESS